MADKELEVRKKVMDLVEMPDPEVSNVKEKMKAGAEKLKGKIDEELMEKVVQPLADAGHENVGAVAGALASAMADMAIPESPAELMPVGGATYKVGKGIRVIDRAVEEVPLAARAKEALMKKRAGEMVKAGGTPDKVIRGGGPEKAGDPEFAREIEDLIGAKGTQAQKVKDK